MSHFAAVLYCNCLLHASYLRTVSIYSLTVSSVQQCFWLSCNTGLMGLVPCADPWWLSFCRGTVTYLDIHDDPAMTIGIFQLPPGARMPLHDHPGMTVFSRQVTPCSANSLAAAAATSGGWRLNSWWLLAQ